MSVNRHFLEKIDALFTRSRGQPESLLRLAIAAAIIAPTLFFLLAAYIAYGSAFAKAEVALQQSARVVSGHAEKVFDGSVLLLRHMHVLLGDQPAEAWRQRESALHATFHELTESLEEVRGVWYWDEAGRAVAGSRIYPAPGDLEVSDREYFIRHKANADASAYISPVISTRTTNAPVFTVSRRHDIGGRFGGVVMASLSPDYFLKYFRELEKASPGLTLSMVREDGNFLARLPAAPAGAKMSLSGPMLQKIANGETAATFMNVSAVDGKTRLVAYRRIGDYPVYAVVGQDRRSILGEWYRNLAVLAAFTFPLALCVAGACWVALRRLRMEQRALADKQAEAEARQRAEGALHESRRLEVLGRLTGSVAHDFNNLLAVVANSVHVQRLLAPELRDSRQLMAIAKAVETGSRLTRQLLSFSRRQALQPQPLQLQQELHELVEVIRTAVGSRVQVQLQIDVETPRIEADRAEMELALLNLALNARDAMPAGGQLLIRAEPVQPVADDGPAWVALRVRDNGTGIPPELLARVREPFFTTKEIGKGTGLGLNQVEGFASQSGGRLEIDSQPGAFTEVTLYLPAIVDEQALLPAGGVQAPLRLSCKVLLVEDNEELAQSTRDLLEGAGCSVVHLPSADAAREMLAGAQGREIEVIVSDVVMPGENSGIDLAVHVRAAYPGLPVVLMTGYTRETERAASHGIPVLNKPVAPDELLALIARLTAARTNNLDRQLARD